MTFPKGLTIVGVLIAIAAVLIDPASAPFLEELIGQHAATKLAAVGALLAALGRAILERTPVAPDQPEPTE